MSKGTILFIDDDNFLRKVYEAELKDKGFAVGLATDGVDGLRKIAADKPDLIILDLIMPEKDGFEVLSDLDRYSDTRDIPVIVLSNLAQSEDQKRALDLGAVDYLVKDNTTLDIIAEKINYYLKVGKKKSTPPASQGGVPALTLREALVKGASEPSVSAPDKTEKKEPATGTGKSDPAKHGHKFCSNCGYKLHDRDKFCPECGEHIE